MRVLTGIGLATLTLLLALGSGAATGAPAGQIHEFTSGLNTGTAPGFIAAGPDGNLWFTDHGTTKAIGRITPAGQIREFTTGLNSGSFPVGIGLGPDGNLWFADDGTTRAIGRITAAGQIHEFDLPSGSMPLGVTRGADGNVWFTDASSSTPAIGRITPSGQIQEFSSGLQSGASPRSIALGPDGNVWFTDHSMQPAIGMATPTGQITEFDLPSGFDPYDIAPGPGGTLWLTNRNGAIDRITPTATTPTFKDFTFGLNSGGSPAFITAGPDGNLWFSDRGTTPALGRITPAGTITEFSSGVPSTASLGSIVAGSDGNVWFTDGGPTRAIGQGGTGGPPALHAPATLSGLKQAGSAETCNVGSSSWGGVTPSAALYGFDGYVWLRNGVPLAGQRSRTYTPTGADVGHTLACRVTLTYPVPFSTSATSTSAVVRVVPTLSALRISPRRFRVTGRRVNHHCVAVTRSNRAHRKCARAIRLHITYALVSPATVTFTITRGTTSLGTITRAGSAGVNRFTFNGRLGGHRLPPGGYRLTARPTAAAVAGHPHSVTFRLAR